MANQKRTVGDTFPPVRGAALDEDGLMDLPSADLIELVAVGPKPFGGPIKVLDPPEDVGDKASPKGFNWRYDLEEGDIAEAGNYAPWLVVTWDSSTTPPEVEWVLGGDVIEVQAAPR